MLSAKAALNPGFKIFKIDQTQLWSWGLFIRGQNWTNLISSKKPSDPTLKVCNHQTTLKLRNWKMFSRH